MESQGPVPYPRFGRVDRFPTSCSALSALCQLEQLGVKPEDIRLILEGRRRRPWPQVLDQDPAPGSPVRHGVEVQLHLALDGVISTFPERVFVSLPGKEGRDQYEAARRLFAPFDKERLLALARLRYWNAVFSGAHRSEAYDAFLFRALGLPEESLQRARRILDPEQIRAWTRILPMLPRIAGDDRSIARILERFLEDPVEIRAGESRMSAVPEGLGMRISAAAVDSDIRRRQAPMGLAFMGSAVREIGTGLCVRIGPLTAERGRGYQGMPFTRAPSKSGGEILIDLGPVCTFERHWQKWDGGRHAGSGVGARSDSDSAPRAGLGSGLGSGSGSGLDPAIDSTRWPLLVYLLEHLLPATATVAVRLVPAVTQGWRLGAKSAPPAAAAASAAGEDDAGFHPSTLGAWTITRRG